MVSKHPFVKLLKEFLAVPSPPGREEKTADLLKAKITEIGFDYEYETSGNLLVRLPCKNSHLPKVMLAAHMDEIAAVVTKVERDGTLCVGHSGRLKPWKMGELPVEIVGDEKTINGVITMNPFHAPEAEEKQSVTWADIRIITGMNCSELKDAGIRPGSTVVPFKEARGPVIFGGDSKDPLIAAWTFDDRGGIITLLRLLETIKKENIVTERPLLVGFTVHEEGGCHGAKRLAYWEKPEIFVTVDGCPVLDDEVLKLDGRPGIWSMDKYTHYDQRLVHELCGLARKSGTELQPVVYDSSASDASEVYSVGGASRIAFVGHVRLNSSGYEVARLSCFDNVLKVLTEYIKTL